jgi:ATP-dependent DNA helicase
MMMNESKKGSSQLDLLLLKAESYSKFIIENQQRSQALQSASPQHVVASPDNTEEKKDKKRSSQSSSTPSKRKKNSGEVDHEEASKPKFLQPPNLVGGDLMPHQIEGLQWLLSLWENGLNGILADEMGLGKTIQIISLIAHLRHHNTAGPYLIAGPLATLTNWVKEFQKWLPTCPVVLYHGDKQEREIIRQKQLRVQNQKSLDFPIVITSFELCIIDRSFLEKYTWQYIILDEGHRIKNRNCKLLKDLKTFRSVSRLLLTGTPIQNSLEELWSLLNFCSPMIFDDLDIFKSWFDFKNIGEETKIEDILDEEENNRIVTKLHEILRPFVLRRLKKDTIGDLVLPKKEIVVYCGMSKLQKEYYSWVLDGTIRDNLINIGVPHAKKISQINQTMNLRKVCNHPFLFGNILEREEENEESAEIFNSQELADQLVAASGKFRVLDRMLPALYQDKHKVLIFSQMTEILNLLEDFLDARGYKFVRFDGATKLAERQESIDAFNAESSDVFVFLLSTRAGGLGINLTAADTAILFDSDWNPTVDNQAQVIR